MDVRVLGYFVVGHRSNRQWREQGLLLSHHIVNIYLTFAFVLSGHACCGLRLDIALL